MQAKERGIALKTFVLIALLCIAKNTGLKQLFHIRADAPAEEDATLLCEIGEQYLVSAEYGSAKKQIYSLSYLTFEINEMAEAVKSAFNQHQQSAHSKACVAAAFPQAVIIPDSLFNASAPHKYFIDSLTEQQVLQDPVAEWQMVVAYPIPKEVHRLFLNTASNVSFHHAYATELKIYDGFVAKDQINIHFVPQQFRVLVKKEGGVQLAQMYRYTSPLDVVYYLLKIMEAFELRKEDTFCLLSGLVQEDSNLYSELSNYFFNLQFAHPAVSIPQNDYPKHFFTSVLNLAACVS